MGFTVIGILDTPHQNLDIIDYTLPDHLADFRQRRQLFIHSAGSQQHAGSSPLPT